MTDLTQEHIERYLKYIGDRNRSKATITCYRRALESFLRFAEENLGETGDEEMAMLWVSTMSDEWTVSTTNHRISVLTSFGKFLGQTWFDDYIRHRPLEREPRALPGGMADVVALIAAAQRAGQVNYMAFLAMCGVMGMRAGEALSVSAQDVDFDEMAITFVRKGGHEAMLPIPLLAAPLLEAAVRRCERPEDRLVQRSMSACGRAVKKQGQAVLGRDISTHDLRATKLTHMERNGVTLSLVQGCAGHVEPRTTQRYVRGNFEELRVAMNV